MVASHAQQDLALRSDLVSAEHLVLPIWLEMQHQLCQACQQAACLQSHPCNHTVLPMLGCGPGRFWSIQGLPSTMPQGIDFSFFSLWRGHHPTLNWVWSLQNILYCPFGLRCGHQLCKICALRCAGMGASLGNPVQLLAKASPKAKCPECQQPGMFEDIMYLNQVDQLVKERQASVAPTLCGDIEICWQSLSEQ